MRFEILDWTVPSDFGRAGEGSVVGDPDQGFELAYFHISTIQIGTIYCMLLCDTNRTAYLMSACLHQFPPIVEALVLQKGQPPPGWPFCVSRDLALKSMGKSSTMRDQVASAAVRTVNRLSRMTGEVPGTVVGGRVGHEDRPRSGRVARRAGAPSSS